MSYDQTGELTFWIVLALLVFILPHILAGLEIASLGYTFQNAFGDVINCSPNIWGG